MTSYVALIILIVFLVIMLTYTKSYGADLDKREKETKCTFSIIENSRARLNGIDFSQAIECETDDLIIKGDLSKKSNQLNAKRAIANSMVSCRSQYGDGDLNLFSGDGLFCAICYLVDFEDPKSETLPGFIDFFYSEKVPRKDKTYSEHLTGISKGDMFQDQIVYSVKDDVLDTSQTYAVMFYYPKGQDYIRKFSETMNVAHKGVLIGGGVIALGAGIVYVGSALSMTGIGATIGIPIAIVGGAVVAVSAAIGWFTTEEADEWAAFTFIRPYDENAFTDCTYLPVKQSDLQLT